MISVNPKKYNLNAKVKLKKSETDIFIVIDRRSRIIMKDGHRIFDIAKQICIFEKNVKISVLTNAPVCSKTKNFLDQNSIAIKGI